MPRFSGHLAATIFITAASAGALLASADRASSAPAGPSAARLPAPPANGELGFVVERFVPAVLPDAAACPDGPAQKVRDTFLQSVPPEERRRLLEKANEREYEQRWQASVFGAEATNICSQPDRFDRPLLRTVTSKRAVGLDLDGDGSGPSCGHESFVGPSGERGIDNQAYRALGCTQEWRGADGQPGEQTIGYRQFLVSGEWTQVILLRGVDSLDRDDQVEVIYGNTADRPLLDTKGQFLAGASFTISDKPPRHRNVLRGRIVNGVLTTEPAEIRLAQTWGQGGLRDIRGVRSRWNFQAARLRLTLQPNGGLQGLLGGYQPVFDLIQAQAIGGVGSATVAGIDCAAQLKTLRSLADGLRDPRTGQCTGVSSALEMNAVPAFVTDVPSPTTARRTNARGG